MRGGHAVLTGAASGIGRAAALRLAREGFDLSLLDRDEEGLRKVATACDAAPYVVDLADETSLGDVIGQVLRVRSCDALVNVAGIGVAATVVETAPQAWDEILAVNLRAPFLLSRAVLPTMLEGDGGTIVNVASVSGLVGVASRAAYCASKAGLIGLTKAIAVDHGREGVRAVAVCPGTVATEWIDKILADAEDPVAARATMADRQLDGRMGTPEEVAAAIAFVASPEARFVNGSELVVDGGFTAR
ncbi:SDR family oxidoreductase [Egibacter rhizosphaerae]|uniref:SDR family oxidoreductase n=1 Tax=Egibacter rhizosphaerae TaxID=1670831 RepID=A0A411YJS6_9ACTN|nr:SDR family oxidoreductase [Egibacter rhizosphaerae]QBI21442.1 SDR family oxidoreductase [Egibacter rhizosphaerae]